VYVSPRETGIPDSLRKHVEDYNLEIIPGYIKEQSECSLSRVIIKFRTHCAKY